MIITNRTKYAKKTRSLMENILKFYILKGISIMNANEMIVNDDVVEVTEEIATAGSGNGIRMAAGIGLAVLGGLLTYKHLIKPMVAKIKARKESKKIAEEFDEMDVVIEEEYTED